MSIKYKNYNKKFQNKQGHVYILTNISIPNQVKIGYTQLDDVELRCQQLSSATGVPTPFKVFASKVFDNCMLAEKMMHSYFSSDNDPDLKKGRVNESREFFWTTPEEALKYLNKIYNDLHKVDKLTEEEITIQLNKGIECVENKSYHEAIAILETLFYAGSYIAAYWLGECYSKLGYSKNINDPQRQKFFYKASDYYSYGVLFQYRPAYQKAYQAYFQAKLAFKSDIVLEQFCNYIQYNHITLTDQEKDMILYHLKRNIGRKNKTFNMYKTEHKCWKIYNKPLRKRVKKLMKKDKNTEELKYWKDVKDFLEINHSHNFLKFLFILILIGGIVFMHLHYGTDLFHNIKFPCGNIM